MINISDNRYFFTKIRYFIFKTKRGWISTPLQSIIVKWMSLFIHRRWEKKKKKKKSRIFQGTLDSWGKKTKVTSHGMRQPLREPYSVFLRKSELPLRAMGMVMLGMIAKGTPTCHPVHEWPTKFDWKRGWSCYGSWWWKSVIK